MRVSYRLSRKDILRFNVHRALRQWLLWVIHGLVFGFYLWTTWERLDSDSALARALAALFTAALVVLLMLVIEGILLLAVSSFGRNRTVLTEHEVTLTEEGVSESTPFGTTFTTWAGITAIRETRRHLLLYTSPNSAHVIPKAAFGGSSACRAFTEFARRQSTRPARADEPGSSPPGP